MDSLNKAALLATSLLMVVVLIVCLHGSGWTFAGLWAFAGVVLVVAVSAVLGTLAIGLCVVLLATFDWLRFRLSQR